MKIKYTVEELYRDIKKHNLNIKIQEIDSFWYTISVGLDNLFIDIFDRTINTLSYTKPIEKYEYEVNYILKNWIEF